MEKIGTVDLVKSCRNAHCREVSLDFDKSLKKGKSNLLLKQFLHFFDADKITRWAKGFNKITCLSCQEEGNKADDRAGSYVLWDAALVYLV